jgi:hypothetical protein
MLELFSAVITGLIFVVGLMIKAAQAKNREDLITKQTQVKDELLEQQASVKQELTDKHQELLAGQNDLRSDFEAKHNENRQGLATHETKDEERFGHVEGRLDRWGGVLNAMDKKLDRLAPRRRAKKR